MKAGLHPEYKEATIKCACGNTVVTKTTKGDISVEAVKAAKKKGEKNAYN